MIDWILYIAGLLVPITIAGFINLPPWIYLGLSALYGFVYGFITVKPWERDY